MDLQAYLRIILRRKWTVITTTLITVVVTFVGTLLMTPVYQSATTLRVATVAQGSLDYSVYDINYTDRLMNTYAKVATSAPLLEELNKDLGVAKHITIKVDLTPNTELLQITAEDQSPILAANAANTLAKLLIAYAKATATAYDQTTQKSLRDQLAQADSELRQAQNQLATLNANTPANADAIAAAIRLLKVKEDTYTTLAGLYERVQVSQSVRGTTVSVVEPATVPPTPSQPRKELNIALGLLVGVTGGFGLAFLLEHLDTTLYTTEQIEHVTEQPVLGKIPTAKERRRFLNSNSPWGEAFRQVRTSLLNVGPNSSLHTLLVTSAEPGEGKSTIATSLAHVLTQPARRVLLIDCDMRAPSVHRILDLPNEVGLSNVLKKEASLDDALRYAPGTGVWVLTSGSLPTHPAELLDSSEMRCFLTQAAERFDIVLLDAPSLLAVTDAAVLAPLVDVVLFVVARAKSRAKEVEEACALLEQMKTKSIGVIINHTEPNETYRYYAKHHPRPRRS